MKNSKSLPPSKNPGGQNAPTTTKEQQREPSATGAIPKKSVLHNVEVAAPNKRVTFHGPEIHQRNTGSKTQTAQSSQEFTTSKNHAPRYSYDQRLMSLENDGQNHHVPQLNITKKITNEIRRDGDAIKQVDGQKYHVPQLNTTKKIAKEIRSIETGKRDGDAIKQVMSQILKETDELRKGQLTKQLNYPLQKKVYTNLIPINVNDSVIQMDAERVPSRKSSVPTRDKDPEPNLADFVDPVPPFKFSDLRSRIKFGPEKFKPPDLSNVSEQILYLHDLTQVDY